jgi:hypothetical protein
LARLQGLDSEYESVPRRLKAAASILGIENLKEYDELTTPTTTCRGHARSEWLLRWLLEKLASSDDSSAAFRSSSLSWKLLSILVDLVPLLNVARLLSHGKLLASVRTTLEESLERNPALKGEHRGVKRKRSEAEDNDPSTIRQNVTILVAKLLDKGISAKSEFNKIPREHLKAALRAKDDLAAELLACWSRACRIEVSKNLSPGRISLSPYIDIWLNRATSSADSSGSSLDSFAENCLVPAILLYSELLNTFNKEFHLKEQIESLFVRHVFLPSKAAYQTAKQQNTTAEIFWSSKLNTALAPLKEVIAYCRNSGNENQLDLFLSSIPHLFQIAIRYTRRETPKYRNSEASWVEAVFISLSEVIGAPLKAQIDTKLRKDDLMHLSISTEPLAALLQVSKEENISLSPVLLSNIVSQIAGLKISTTGGMGNAPTVEWPLIKQVIDVDSSIFVLSDGVKSQSMSDEHILRVRLLNELSKVHFGVVAPDESKAARDELLVRIVAGLMKGFADLNRLVDFISLWHTEIVKCVASLKTEKDAVSSVWVADAFAQEAQHIWRSVLSSSQTKSFISLYLEQVVDFRDTVAQNGASDRSIIELNGWPETWASLVLLDTLLLSTQQFETLKDIRQQLEKLWTAISSLLENKNLPIEFSKRLWRILTKLELRLNQSLDIKAVLQHTKNASKSKVIKVAQKRLKKASGESELLVADDLYSISSFLLAFTENYSLSRLEAAGQPHLEIFKTVAVFVQGWFRLTSSGSKVDANQIGQYLALITQYPSIIQEMADEGKETVFSHILDQKYAPVLGGEYFEPFSALQASVVSTLSRRNVFSLAKALLDVIRPYFASDGVVTLRAKHAAELIQRLSLNTLSKPDRDFMISEISQLLQNVDENRLSDSSIFTLMERYISEGKQNEPIVLQTQNGKSDDILEAEIDCLKSPGIYFKLLCTVLC